MKRLIVVLRSAAAASILALLFVSFVAGLFPPKAFAAGETYRWTSHTTVEVSGGDLQTSTFTATGPASTSLRGTMTHRTGCQFRLNLLVSAFNNSGTLSIPQSVGSPGSPSGINNPCSPDIANPYNNQRVTIQGTRPGPGDAEETHDQKRVSVILYSPSPASQSPQTVTFTYKNAAGQTVDTTTSPQHSDTAGNSPDPNLRVVRYLSTTYLEPGDYTVCPSAIAECRNFRKEKYQPASISLGESLSSRDVIVKVEVTTRRSLDQAYSAGPAQISLQKADGTGETLTAQTNTITIPASNDTSVVDSTVTLEGSFSNISAGVYKACVTVINVCQNITKDAGNDAQVTLRVSGSDADNLTGNPSGNKPKTCAQEAKGIGWLFCPLIISMSQASEKLTEFIVGLLELKTEQMFTDPDTSPAYKAAWAGFRNIAYAILVIIGLIMVASQVFNVEILSAYTLRKMLPGIIAAVVFVTFSWEIMEFLYNLSNDAAYALADIIQAPFQGIDSVAGVIEGNVLQDLFGRAALGILTAIGLAGVAIYAALGGVTVILALAASFILSLFSVYVLLEARNVVAVLLLILSSVAIICAAFEPFKKVFIFWRGLVIVIIVTVPGVAVVLTFASVGSLIAAAPGGPGDILTAFIILIAGFAMVWTLFLQMDKITGFMGNVASKVTGKAQQALAGYRSNTLKRRTGEVLSGQREMGLLGTTMRYGSMAGRPGMPGMARGLLTKEGRAKMALAEAALLGKTSHDLLKNEDGSVSGNDDAMAVITKGVKNAADYEAKYVERKKAIHDRNNAIRRAKGEQEQVWDEKHQSDAQHEALETRQEIETRMRSDIGTRATRLAAAHARWGSVSAYNDYNLDSKEGRRGMRAEMAEEIGGMMDSGLMTMTEVAATLKKNNQRTDISGHSFPQIMFQAQEIAKRYKERKAGKGIKGRKMDETGGVVTDKTTGRAIETDLYVDSITGGTALMSDDEMEAWDRRSIEYVNAGQDMGQRTEAVKVHAGVARERIQKQFRKFNKELLAARKDSKAAEQQIIELKPQLEAAVAEEARALSGAVPSGMGAIEYEQRQRGAQEKVRTIRQQMVQAQAEQAKHQGVADQIQVELVRQMATAMGKQTVMGSYSSPENQRVFYEGLLSQPIDITNPNGPTIMQYGEQLREESEVFRNFERSYTQRATAGAQAALAQQTAAGAQAGPGGGMPPPGLGR